MLPDIQRVTDIIRDTAAAEVMPRFQNLAHGDIAEKRPGDLVTAADIAAEKRLESELTALVPGAVVVGEEAAEVNPGLLHLLTGDAPVWVVDPVDGTHNFAHAKACFAVIVAYCVAGRTVAGWIHDPVADVTAWAAEGQGTWIGERRLRVASPAPLEALSGSLGYRLRRRLQTEHPGGLGRGRLVRYGCVGREYMDLARGDLHFARYARRLKPWDHAAGVLLHREAGGFSALVHDRAPYRPDDGGVLTGTLMLAPDEATWDALHDAIDGG